MDQVTLKSIEDAAFAHFNPSPTGPNSEQQKIAAEATLALHFPTFSESTLGVVSNASPTKPMSPLESLTNCQQVLELSGSPYAQLFSVLHLKALIISHFQLFSVPQKIELRNFLLNYLGSHGTNLQPYVLSALAELFGLITKLGWFDADEFQNALEDVSTFLRASNDHRMVGLVLLSCLVLEMNRLSTVLKNMTRHRKVAVNFRDLQLARIFKLSLEALKELVTKQVTFNSASEEGRLLECSIQLVRNCLCFDFIGTNPDDSSEDVGSISFPNSWRPSIIDTATLQLLYDAYVSFPEHLAFQVLECLSLVISARRSLFSDEEKAQSLSWVMDATISIVERLLQEMTMNEKEYHEFARFLVRLKSVNQLTELMDRPQFSSWLETLGSFTIQCFHPNKWATNSVIYMLTFWSKIAATVPSPPYSRAYEKIADISVAISKGFVSCRILAADMNDEESRDLLEDEATLTTVLEYLANVARLNYKPTTEYFHSVFDICANQYNELYTQCLNGQISGDFGNKLSYVETKLTWLVYVMASCVGAKSPIQNTEEHEILDSDVTAKVLHLMNIDNDFYSLLRKMGTANNRALDLGILYFLYQFRKIYIGPHMDIRQGREIYNRLGEAFGIDDQSKMLNLIEQKLCNNMKFCGNFEALINRSVDFFSELASGYSPIRYLRKTETAQVLLRFHNAEYFPFLDANRKKRAIYYATLCRLLFTDDNMEVEALEFLSLFNPALQQLSNLPNLSSFRDNSIRNLTDGLFRDLRGFVSAIELSEAKPSYLLFFNWFYPHMPITLRVLEANFDHPVANTVLKFFAEFVLNRAQRLVFDISSPNGILLFRETAKVLQAYGKMAIPLQVEGSRKWVDKYKGYTACFKILKNCLAGNYVHFGVFELYSDPALTNALEILFELMLSIPLADLMAFPKLTTEYFSMLDVFSKGQLLKLKGISPSAVEYIFRSCAEAVKDADKTNSTSACNVIENIATFLFQQTHGPSNVLSISGQPQPSILLQRISEQPELIHLMLTRILEACFAEDANDWSLSRPLLPLVLLDKSYFDFYVGKLISGQLEPRQPVLLNAFQELMDGVQFNLLPTNKNKFTQQLLHFRRNLMTQNFILIVPSTEF